MERNQEHSILLTRTYNTSAASIFNLFEDDTVFQLTGANEIQSEFKTGGAFRLTFNERGIIYGRFITIDTNTLILEWNVEGFQRPPELKTSVEISLKQVKDHCLLTLSHSGILDKDSVKAKQKAWTEILEDIEKQLTTNI